MTDDTDTTTTDVLDGLPSLFDEFDSDVPTKLDASDRAAMIQAKAMCRMAAIQQAQLEMQQRQREQAHEMFEDMQEDIEDLFGQSGSRSDDFRYDPDDDDPLF